MNLSAPRIPLWVDHGDALVTIGLRTMLGQAPDIDVLEEAPRGGVGGHDSLPVVIVADYERGLQAAALLRGGARGRSAAPIRVLVLSAQEREHAVRTALDAGVDGYIEQGCAVQEVLEGVRQLARGTRYFSARVACRIAESVTHTALTQREQEVLALMARGQSNKGIARDLGIAVGTVKAHVKAVLGKLEAASRTEAASIALDRGLVLEPPARG